MLGVGCQSWVDGLEFTRPPESSRGGAVEGRRRIEVRRREASEGGSRSRFQGLNYMVEGLGCRVSGVGCRVQGVGCWEPTLGC